MKTSSTLRILFAVLLILNPKLHYVDHEGQDQDDDAVNPKRNQMADQQIGGRLSRCYESDSCSSVFREPSLPLTQKMLRKMSVCKVETVVEDGVRNSNKALSVNVESDDADNQHASWCVEPFQIPSEGFITAELKCRISVPLDEIRGSSVNILVAYNSKVVEFKEFDVTSEPGWTPCCHSQGRFDFQLLNPSFFATFFEDKKDVSQVVEELPIGFESLPNDTYVLAVSSFINFSMVCEEKHDY